MRIRILGAGWYGCHLAAALKSVGHDPHVFDIAPRAFNGASGSIPARLHEGFHYPRSWSTRDACQKHRIPFLAKYGHLTAGPPVNLYAVAAVDSLLDFRSYLRVISEQCEFAVADDLAALGLDHCEGAVFTRERHIVSDRARAHFEAVLGDRLHLRCAPGETPGGEGFDLSIDCTFCANDSANVDRYEPCLTVLLRGPVQRAVTVMDGPFPSLYPWDEERGLCSLTSARFTPLARCRTYADAREVIEMTDPERLKTDAERMIDQMAYFYPAVGAFEIHELRTSIRAMPKSGSDARLVDVIEVGPRALRVRAGKIDAVFDAERAVFAYIGAHA